MEVKSVAADALFRVFTACPTDPRTLILDVRPHKQFDRAPGHVAGAYCIRLSANGAALLDYSKREDLKWGADVWWGKDVIVYGEAGLRRDHPVVAHLAADKHARSLSIYKEGLEAFAKQYPFLVTTSVKAGAAAARRYPSQLDPLLYLGDWAAAEAVERHAELGIRAVLTIHNNPANLALPPGKYARHQVELADVDTADISAALGPAYDFIEEQRAAKRAVLVHCGAGVSRSATLAIYWLMRKHRWSAQKALEFAKARRSLVAPNDGFWRTLCSMEAGLGIAERSNADAFVGFHGADAKPGEPEQAAPVRVTWIPAGVTSAPAGNKPGAAAAPAAAPAQAAPVPAADGRAREGGEAPRRRSRSRSRERDRRSSRSRDRRRSRSRDRRRSRSRDRRRSRSRDRRRSRSRDRRRSRSRGRGDDRGRGAPAAAAPPAAQQQAAAPAVEMVDLESTPGVVLEVAREGTALGAYVLEMQRASHDALVGRLPSCGVLLEHPSASRAHAQLTTDGRGNLFLTDLGSAHGTNVDGAWIKPKVPKQLRAGSVLKFGASSREYRVARLPPPAARRP